MGSVCPRFACTGLAVCGGRVAGGICAVWSIAVDQRLLACTIKAFAAPGGSEGGCLSFSLGLALPRCCATCTCPLQAVVQALALTVAPPCCTRGCHLPRCTCGTEMHCFAVCCYVLVRVLCMCRAGVCAEFLFVCQGAAKSGGMILVDPGLHRVPRGVWLTG